MRPAIALTAALLLVVVGCGPPQSAPAGPPVTPAERPAAIDTPEPGPTYAFARPSPSPAHPSATPTPPPSTAAATPAPAPSPASAVVANTGGEGVYLRATKHLADKLRAYPDGTSLAVRGPPEEGDGLQWLPVRAPDGAEGWVPRQYTAPVGAATAPPAAATPLTVATARPPTITAVPPLIPPTRVPVPTAPPTTGAGVPSGVTAVRRDGTISYSAHRQGTCSHHGGVGTWVNRPPN